jgi:hypothetical protein
MGRVGRYRVHFFELRLDRLPRLQLDNREIIAARLASPEELGGMQLPTIGVIGEYVGRISNETKRRPLYLVAETLIGSDPQNRT